MNKETCSIIVIHNILPMFCKHFCNFLPTKWFLTSQLLTKLLSPVSKCGTNFCLLWGSTVISHWQHDISNGMHTRSSVWITLTFSTSLFMFYLTKGINNSVDYCGVCADDVWLKQPHLAPSLIGLLGWVMLHTCCALSNPPPNKIRERSPSWKHGAQAPWIIISRPYNYPACNATPLRHCVWRSPVKGT